MSSKNALAFMVIFKRKWCNQHVLEIISFTMNSFLTSILIFSAKKVGESAFHFLFWIRSEVPTALFLPLRLPLWFHGLLFYWTILWFLRSERRILRFLQVFSSLSWFFNLISVDFLQMHFRVVLSSKKDETVIEKSLWNALALLKLFFLVSIIAM